VKTKTFILKLFKVDLYHFIPTYFFGNCNKKMTSNSSTIDKN